MQIRLWVAYFQEENYDMALKYARLAKIMKDIQMLSGKYEMSGLKIIL